MGETDWFDGGCAPLPKPSRYLDDEGRKERTEQPLESAQRSGGVSGEGLLERADGVTREPERSGDRQTAAGSPAGVNEANLSGYGNARGNERLHDHYGLVNFPMHTKWQTS